MGATLRSRLPLIAKELRPAVSKGIKKGAEDIAKDAARRVAVGPPDVHIGEEIIVQRVGPAEYAVVAGGRGEGQAYYGHMIEFGTRFHYPKPFLVPAADDGFPGAVRHVLDALGWLR